MMHKGAACDLCFILLAVILMMKGSCGKQSAAPQAYLTYQIIGIKGCLDKCLRISRCQSFNYNEPNLTCLLYTTNMGFYTKDIAEAYTRISCSKTSHCLENHQGQATCVKDEYRCGDSPVIPHTKKIAKGSYIGAQTVYTCHSSYIPCFKKMSSVCQASGKWSDVVDLCGRARYKRVKTCNKYSIPCGPSSGFTVTVLATPTNKKRFEIVVWSGKNQLLAAYFCFKWNGYINKMGLNSVMYGQWGPKTYISRLTLTVGKEARIDIKYSNNMFKVLTDGGNEQNFSIQTPLLAKSVWVCRDVRVRHIEFTRGTEA